MVFLDEQQETAHPAGKLSNAARRTAAVGWRRDG
jgi:hypothetical protein